MKEFNPEIRKFWEQAGYSVGINRPAGNIANCIWNIIYIAYNLSGSPSSSLTKVVGVSESIGGPNGVTEDNYKILYQWKSQLYSEDKMLKIIRQKAFI